MLISIVSCNELIHTPLAPVLRVQIFSIFQNFLLFVYNIQGKVSNSHKGTRSPECFFKAQGPREAPKHQLRLPPEAEPKAKAKAKAREGGGR